MSVHHNYIKSSDFMLISAGLGVVNIAIAPEIFSSGLAIISGIFALLFITALALLIRKGISWIKYLLLAIMLIGLIGVSTIIKNLRENPAVGIINIIQTVFQFWALLLLFKIPKEKV